MRRYCRVSAHRVSIWGCEIIVSYWMVLSCPISNVPLIQHDVSEWTPMLRIQLYEYRIAAFFAAVVAAFVPTQRCTLRTTQCASQCAHSHLSVLLPSSACSSFRTFPFPLRVSMLSIRYLDEENIKLLSSEFPGDPMLEAQKDPKATGDEGCYIMPASEARAYKNIVDAIIIARELSMSAEILQRVKKSDSTCRGQTES